MRFLGSNFFKKISKKIKNLVLKICVNNYTEKISKLQMFNGEQHFLMFIENLFYYLVINIFDQKCDFWDQIFLKKFRRKYKIWRSNKLF